MKKGEKFAISAFFAAVIGYLVGIFTAPKSGKESREDVKQAASKAVTQGEKKLKELHSELNDLIDDLDAKMQKAKGKAKEELDKRKDTAVQARDKARNVLSALHEGDSDDKELKKALEQAKKAKESLKAYLKK